MQILTLTIIYNYINPVYIITSQWRGISVNSPWIVFICIINVATKATQLRSESCSPIVSLNVCLVTLLPESYGDHTLNLDKILCCPKGPKHK